MVCFLLERSVALFLIAWIVCFRLLTQVYTFLIWWNGWFPSSAQFDIFVCSLAQFWSIKWFDFAISTVLCSCPTHSFFVQIWWGLWRKQQQVIKHCWHLQSNCLVSDDHSEQDAAEPSDNSSSSDGSDGSDEAEEDSNSSSDDEGADDDFEAKYGNDPSYDSRPGSEYVDDQAERRKRNKNKNRKRKPVSNKKKRTSSRPKSKSSTPKAKPRRKLVRFAPPPEEGEAEAELPPLRPVTPPAAAPETCSENSSSSSSSSTESSLGPTKPKPSGPVQTKLNSFFSPCPKPSTSGSWDLG